MTPAPPAAPEVPPSKTPAIIGFHRDDVRWLVALPLMALFIWLRDLGWMGSLEETLPILVALPLFFWFGAPWKRVQTPDQAPFPWLLAGSALFAVGVLIDFTLLMTAGWVTLLAAWLRTRLAPGELASKSVLLILPAMAFPWLVLEGRTLGWFFRLSAAWCTEWVFSLLQFAVVRQGTELLIYGTPIGVDASCAGLNALQSMLIAGSLVAYLMLGSRAKLYWMLPLLVALAWLSNTLRVWMLSAVALTFGHEVASGWFHKTGGWILLTLMFALCVGLFSLLRPAPKS